jgi:hypothetical protein
MLIPVKARNSRAAQRIRIYELLAASVTGWVSFSAIE